MEVIDCTGEWESGRACIGIYGPGWEAAGLGGAATVRQF